MLYLGTLFAPCERPRQARPGIYPSSGRRGDHLARRSELGELVNTVRLSTEAPEWTFGTAALMRQPGRPRHSSGLKAA